MNSKQTILEVKNVSKTFPGVAALRRVYMSFKSGEVHALVGENGAGKSTLMNVLYGVILPDEGSQIFHKGKQITIRSTQDADSHRIAMIHQETSLVQHLTVYENISLGHFPKKGLFIDKEKAMQTAQNILNELNIAHIRPTALIKDLSSSEQQLIEIAKGLTSEPDVIIMDEPTAALTVTETEILMDIIHDLKSRGVAIIFISHHIDEIFQIADVVSVLRDGLHVGTYNIDEVTAPEIIKYMVGRELESYVYQRTAEEIKKRQRTKDNAIVLEVDGVSRPGRVKDASFRVHEGEILGFAGLVGAGRTELMECVYGSAKYTTGSIKIHGEEVNVKSPTIAVERGLGMVSENRIINGILPLHSVRENINSASWKELRSGIFLERDREEQNAKQYIDRMNIVTPAADTRISNLSGGNQQKALFSRMLSIKPKILILDEPTQGIDVGAKAEIYSIINELADSGISIILISSELPELIYLSHRILTMYEGTINGALEFEEFDQAKIMTFASGAS